MRDTRPPMPDEESRRFGPETDEEIQARLEEEADEDYSGDDPCRPTRGSGLPCLEEILSWQRLK